MKDTCDLDITTIKGDIFKHTTSNNYDGFWFKDSVLFIQDGPREIIGYPLHSIERLVITEYDQGKE